MTAKEMMGAIAFTTEGRNKTLDNGIELLMIKFAKMKVQETLEVVAYKAIVKVQKKSQYGKYRKWQNVRDNETDLFEYTVMYTVDKDSILNTYDLNNIK